MNYYMIVGIINFADQVVEIKDAEDDNGVILTSKELDGSHPAKIYLNKQDIDSLIGMLTITKSRMK